MWIEIAGNASIQLLEIRRPPNSILPESLLQTVQGKEVHRFETTQLKLGRTPGDDQLWDDWWRSNGRGYTAKIKANNKVLHVQLLPHRQPVKRVQGWVVVQNESAKGVEIDVKHLSPLHHNKLLSAGERTLIGESPTANAINAADNLKQALENLSKTRSPKDPIVWSKTALATNSRLHQLFLLLEGVLKQVPATPEINKVLQLIPVYINDYIVNADRDDWNVVNSLSKAAARYKRCWDLACRSVWSQHANQAYSTLPTDYMELVIQLRERFTALQTVLQLTSNPDVKGAFIEAEIRRIYQSWTKDLSVSTGGILSVGTDDQIDGIIWDQEYMPAVVEVSDVVLVHPGSIRGIFEVKKSTSTLSDFSLRLARIEAQLSGSTARDFQESRRVPVLGIIISDRTDNEILSARTGGRAVSLFQSKRVKQNNVTVTVVTVNEAALYSLVTFFYSAVLPFHRSVRKHYTEIKES